MHNRVLTITICTLILCFSAHLVFGHTALLQENSSSSGSPHYWFDNSTSLYNYVEENNELFLSGIQSHSCSGSGDSPTITFDYSYHVNHTTVINNDGKTCYYNIYSDSTNTLRSQKIYTIDNQSRLIYLMNGSTYYYNTMQKTYNLTSGLFESCTYHYSSTSYFYRHFFSHDNLNRISVDSVYTSTDSINWQLSRIKTVQYGAILPYSLNLEMHETFDISIIDFLINPEYQIQSFSDYIVDGAYTQSWYFTYTLNPGFIKIEIRDNPDYWSRSYSYRFETSGRMIGYGSSDDFFKSGIEFGTSYIWGEYVDNQDAILNPSCFNAYPNPFKTSLIIKFPGTDKAPSDISIYNIKGQLIRTWKNTKATELSWDGRDSDNKPVSSGVYLIKAKQGKHAMTCKVIKL